ncbi:hypothetical protein SBADM41S_11824 [Streptomyces badius]
MMMPGGGFSYACLRSSWADLKRAWASLRRSRTDSASLTASSNSLAVLVTNSLVTVAFSPFHVDLSALDFIALASSWRGVFSLPIISVHWVTAVSIGPRRAVRSCSKVGTVAAPYRKYLLSWEAGTAPSAPGATGPTMRSCVSSHSSSDFLAFFV